MIAVALPSPPDVSYVLYILAFSLFIYGLADNDTFNKVILVIAIAFGTINVVGGFLVTDRMLEMFKRRPEPKKDPGS